MFQFRLQPKIVSINHFLQNKNTLLITIILLGMYVSYSIKKKQKFRIKYCWLTLGSFPKTYFRAKYAFIRCISSRVVPGPPIASVVLSECNFRIGQKLLLIKIKNKTASVYTIQWGLGSDSTFY